MEMGLDSVFSILIELSPFILKLTTLTLSNPTNNHHGRRCILLWTHKGQEGANTHQCPENICK
jgi:hypothetical protein